MSFQQGLSGLSAASKALDTVGNNVANSGTIGFKTANTTFSDVFAASLTVGNQVGIGTSVAGITQQFTQGNISVTNNALDLAINGQGFYRLSNDDAISWTRNGQFNLNKDGYIVNSGGYRLTGYLADANNNIVPSTPADIRIETADLQPTATGGSSDQTGLEIGLNLDSRAPVIPAATVFSATNPTTYTSSTSATVYDSLGNPQLLSIFFRKNATANTWDVYTKLGAAAAVATTPAQIVFNSSGALITPANGILPQSWALTNGAVTPLGPAFVAPATGGFNLDLTGSTQYGSLFGVNSLRQDGYASGRLSGLSVASDGTIQGRYTNGQSRDLAQVALGNFTNPNGLASLGGNQWAETADSGQPLIGVPGSSSLGVIQSAAIEESNVDLTAELVNMITLQRAYQASAQTIKTQDQVLQTLVNLR